MTLPVYDHTEMEAKWKRDFGHCKTPADFREAVSGIVAKNWVRITGKSFDDLIPIARMDDPTCKAQAAAFKAMGINVTARPGGQGVVDFVVNGKVVFSGWDDATMAKIAKVDWGKK